MSAAWLALLVGSFVLLGCGERETPAPASEQHGEVREDEIALLKEIGYATEVPITGPHVGKAGVTLFDPAAVQDGLNFFNSLEAYTAKLMTMSGREVHRWSSDEKGATWGRFHARLPSLAPSYLDGWAHTELLENGDLLVIGAHHMLLRLDWDSNVEWKLELSAHHDLAVADDGDIHVLTAAIASVEIDGEPHAFLDNRIVVVTADGKIERTVSIFEALSFDPWSQRMNGMLREIKRVQTLALEKFRASGAVLTPEFEDYVRLIQSAFRGETAQDEDLKILLFQNSPEDLFHVNSIQILPRSRPGLWRKGDWLIVIPVFEMIAVIDHESGRVIWTWGRDELQRPHHATLQPDGNILIFDNGIRRMYSRVVKMDPESGRIVWQYRADPPESFFSDSRGGAQGLPNGNVLIADTNNGRAFEVTPAGYVVWEYYNDELYEEKGVAKRGALFRFTRVDPSSIEPLASRAGSRLPAEPEGGRAGQ